MPGPTPQHQIVKAEKLAAAAVGMIEQELKVPNLMQKEGVDQFKGAEDDTITVKVEGVLPFHEYGWRNDRSEGIKFDTYSERKIPVTFGGNVYNAVKLTDEQNDFDLENWTKLLRPQVKAVARGLERRAVTTLESNEYECVIGGVEAGVKNGIIEARRVLNAFQAPGDDRYMLVGSDFESVLLADESLSLAQNIGDSEAESVLTMASLGRRFGFRFIVDQTIQSDAAYAFTSSAFVFANAAPSVPQSVPFGATQSFEGIALRWVRDYDSEYMQDRSVVNTYYGYRSVKDVLVGWDDKGGKEVVSDGEHFVRGIKLTLDGDSTYPTGELATITGVSGPGRHLVAAAAAASAGA